MEKIEIKGKMKNDMTIKLSSEKSELRQVLAKLQTIYDNSFYTDSFYCSAELNEKQDNFKVIFSYDSENTFTETIEKIYDENVLAISKKEEERVEMSRLSEIILSKAEINKANQYLIKEEKQFEIESKKAEISKKYMKKIHDLEMEFLEKLEAAGITDPDQVFPEIDSRLAEVKTKILAERAKALAAIN